MNAVNWRPCDAVTDSTKIPKMRSCSCLCACTSQHALSPRTSAHISLNSHYTVLPLRSTSLKLIGVFTEDKRQRKESGGRKYNRGEERSAGGKWNEGKIRRERKRGGNENRRRRRRVDRKRSRRGEWMIPSRQHFLYLSCLEELGVWCDGGI